MARSIMKSVALIFLFFLEISRCQDYCIIDIDCDQCFPDHLPFITSHPAIDNIVKIPHGEEATLHCHKSKFKLYPELNVVKAICDSGLFRTFPDDFDLKQISDLGCQSNYFEDVLHPITNCNQSMQGRSYQYHDTVKSSVQHLVETCYDPIKGRTLFTHMTFSNNNNILHNKHDDSDNKISFLETFSRMTDDTHKLESEKVYSNDEIMNRKLKTLMGNDSCNLAGQKLITAKMLPARFFHNQNGIVTKYPSNKIAVWGSVVNGNMKHLQNDIYNAFYTNSKKNNSANIDIYVGTHDTLTLPIRFKEQEIYLKPAKKYPVPKYVYTIVQDKSMNKGIALIIVNNPFLSVSDIRNTVFCPSMCSSVSWLDNLKLTNNYERIVYGLVFCCDLHSFSNIVSGSPNILSKIHVGETGLLKKLN